MDEQELIARIKSARRDRGRYDAENGEPPTEANAEYQQGYLELRSRHNRFGDRDVCGRCGGRLTPRLSERDQPARWCDCP